MGVERLMDSLAGNGSHDAAEIACRLEPKERARPGIGVRVAIDTSSGKMKRDARRARHANRSRVSLRPMVGHFSMFRRGGSAGWHGSRKRDQRRRGDKATRQLGSRLGSNGTIKRMKYD